MFLGKNPEKEDKRSASLLGAERSVLLIVDAQERFRGAVAGFDAAADRIALLAKAAARLNIPVMVSEQYPKALGKTVPAVAEALPAGTSVLEKLCFSSFDLPEWTEALRASRRNQFVLCGVEAHVCVLQTALDALQNLEGQVYVVEDAVASRKDSDKDAALRRLESHGAQRVTAEMVVFEWLRRAGTAEFKDLQALIK